ncbi:CBU_0592 family membrane protein [Pedobacter gandavensis]|uniref:CBU_0592 family membrane protein n=1 Tax=Pedobacter gandavensis TaxID=2679963 RepID=UPI00292F76D5|nr:hypothetical protein [Pedobacter gandavensis]
MFQIVISEIGWVGVVLCTLGYLLLSVKVLKADSLSFQTLNIIGGLCLVTSALHNSDMPNAVANGLWVLIGFYAVARHIRSNRVAEKS